MYQKGQPNVKNLGNFSRKLIFVLWWFQLFECLNNDKHIINTKTKKEKRDEIMEWSDESSKAHYMKVL